MNKSPDKFCPHCGHHLYRVDGDGDPLYWCAECNEYLEPADVVTADKNENDAGRESAV